MELFRETAAILGLKKQVRSTRDWLPVIRLGLPGSSLESVARQLEMTSAATMESLGLAKRTVARRLQEKARFTAEESERLWRGASVLALATEVFGSKEKACRWLQKPNRALGQEVPLSLLDTGIGANLVVEELGRIDHGVFA